MRDGWKYQNTYDLIRSETPRPTVAHYVQNGKAECGAVYHHRDEPRTPETFTIAARPEHRRCARCSRRMAEIEFSERDRK